MEEIKDIVIRIRKYYSSIKQIKFLEGELERLERKRAKYINDVETDKIHIEILNSAVNYSDCKVKGNNQTSPIEKGLDLAFERLEKSLALVVKRINCIKLEIELIEISIDSIRKSISLLDDDCRRYIELRYRDNNFNYEIENAMHLSRMQVQGLKNRALRTLVKSFNDIQISLPDIEMIENNVQIK